MTLTLVTVYAPLAFATGRTGRLFIEFALAWPARCWCRASSPSRSRR